MPSFFHRSDPSASGQPKGADAIAKSFGELELLRRELLAYPSLDAETLELLAANFAARERELIDLFVSAAPLSGTRT